MLEKQFWGHFFYEKLSKILKGVTEKHTPLKKQKLRKNQTPFMTKQLFKKSHKC